MIRYALLLALLLSGCRDDGQGIGPGDSNPVDPDWQDLYPDERDACVDRINAFRATLDLEPLDRWRDAEACSDGEAESDASTGTAHGAFGDCGEWAQNECPGWASLENVVQNCLQMMWDEGPGDDFNQHGHYINMTSTEYTRVACGFHVTADGEVWSVQNFR